MHTDNAFLVQVTYEAVLEKLMRSDPTQLHEQLHRWPLHLYSLRGLGTSLRSFIDELKVFRDTVFQLIFLFDRFIWINIGFARA